MSLPDNRARESGDCVIDWGNFIVGVDMVARETLLFAAVGFLIGGIDDLAVDLVFIVRSVWRRLTLSQRDPVMTLADIADAPVRGPIAVFVAAWDEALVIGAMLEASLARFDHPDYRIYVGTYPNDPGTIDAVASVAERDPSVRLVVGPVNGPTTKAACLNTIWHALIRAEAADGPGVRARAIVIHDAEDVVHPGELRIFDRLIGPHAAVQLPVLPLVDRGSRLVSGHYIDEFAEAHAKQLVVREALGAGLPLAGVGCAIAREALESIATARGGDPFDAQSLTEDYELGLAIATLGGSSVLARVPERRGGPIVAVRAFFPATVEAAVRQKARWMTGIALAGWDRIGWARPLQFSEHWMRMRDRRAPIAVMVLGAAYLALFAWPLSQALHWLDGGAPQPLPIARWLLLVNIALLIWRLVMRMLFTGLACGPVEAILALPRAIVGNVIALLAARRAISRYIALLRGQPLVWDKTAHAFPDNIDIAAAATR